MVIRSNSIIEERLDELAKVVQSNSYISPELYNRYNVKRGLRNQNGTGVLVGITRVGSVIGYDQSEGAKIPVEGNLYYRGVGYERYSHRIPERRKDGIRGGSLSSAFRRTP